MVCSLEQWRDLLALHTYPAGLACSTLQMHGTQILSCTTIANTKYTEHEHTDYIAEHCPAYISSRFGLFYQCTVTAVSFLGSFHW